MADGLRFLQADVFQDGSRCVDHDFCHDCSRQGLSMGRSLEVVGSHAPKVLEVERDCLQRRHQLLRQSLPMATGPGSLSEDAEEGCD